MGLSCCDEYGHLSQCDINSSANGLLELIRSQKGNKNSTFLLQPLLLADKADRPFQDGVLELNPHVEVLL